MSVIARQVAGVGAAGFLLLGASGAALGATPQAGPDSPGAPVYDATNGQSRFGNAAVSASWTFADGALANLVVADGLHDRRIPVTDPFSLTFR